MDRSRREENRPRLPIAIHLALGAVCGALARLASPAFCETSSSSQRRAIHALEKALLEFKSAMDAEIFAEFPRESGADARLLGRIYFGAAAPLSDEELATIAALHRVLSAFPLAERNRHIRRAMISGEFAPIIPPEPKLDAASTSDPAATLIRLSDDLRRIAESLTHPSESPRQP